MKRSILIISIILIMLLIMAGCTTTQTEESTYTDISVMDAKELMESMSELVVIDVSPAYADGHLPKAINYPLGDGSLDEAIPMLDKDKTFLVYCHSDSASMAGAQKLIDAGFMNVYRLEGNYAAWVDAGYMIEGIYTDISVMDAMELMESMPELVVIDVSPAYADGHLPNAINYPLGDGSLDEAIPMLDKDKTYLVYCHSDSASMTGAQKLIDAGFMNVYRLEGNYAAWVEAGYKIEGIYMDISVMNAKELMESMPELVVIDVSPLYADGHLPNAINYPLGDGSLDEAIPMLDKDSTYLVYCHSDSASMAGAQKLIDAGFMNVYRLEGNYAAWVEAGYKIEGIYMDISVMNAKELMESMPELVVIDVSPLYADGHLPNAINYPLGDGSLDEAIPMLDKDKTYLVYCHSDAASMAGAQKLIDAGFKTVYRLEGNYAAWVDAGYMIEGKYMEISAVELKDLMDSMPDLMVIDVSSMYADGHLPNAVNYYGGNQSLDEAIPMLDKNKSYVIYCHSDAPSIADAQKLVDAGFKSVFRLEGNYGAWADAGFEIVK